MWSVVSAAVIIYDACDIGQAQSQQYTRQPRPAASAALAVALRGCLSRSLRCHRDGCRIGALRRCRCPRRCCRSVGRARPPHAVEDAARAVCRGLHYAVGTHRPCDAIGCLGLLGLRLCAAVGARLYRLGCLCLHRLGITRVGLFMAAAADRGNKQQRQYHSASHVFTYLVIADTCSAVSSALPASLSKYATSSTLSWNRLSVSTAAHRVSRHIAKLAIQ